MRGPQPKLNCFLFNSRSIVNKLLLLHSFVCSNSPDIVFITETWLNSKILNAEIVGGYPYNVIRSDRSSQRGGGVCCLIKNGLIFNPIAIAEQLISDIICMDIISDRSGSSASIRMILLYRPPRSAVEEDDKLIDVLYDLCSAPTPVILISIY